MSNPYDVTVHREGIHSNSRRLLLKASAALATLSTFAASSVVQAADKHTTTDIAMNDAKSEEFINGLADLMVHSTRTPILRWPNEYGMKYEEIFFQRLMV